MITKPAPATAEFPRQYVDPEADFGDWSVAEQYYRELADREVNTLAEFEQWMLDFSELDAAFAEEGTRRYINMTRQTDREELVQAHLHFVENVAPHREPWQHLLGQKFVKLAEKLDLPKERYEVLERSVRNAIELFREENIPLMVELAKLSQKYQQRTGALTVEYQGEELTLQQLARYLEEPDRKVREQTWRLGAERFYQEADDFDKLYQQMVQIRHNVADNAGCADYREFAFRAMERFDYTPEGCLEFHDAVERVVVPAAKKLADERREKLGVEKLRPWDMACDPEQRPPLRPFETDDDLKIGCSKIFHRVEPDLGQIFETMRERDLLDLASRKGKAPGGYMSNLEEQRTPFIFMNAVGTEGDVRTLLHEGGHAFHTWSCRNDPLLAYRNYPIEFAEVASMAMEMLSLPHYEEFYGENANRARKNFLQGVVNFFPFMARVDAWQHYVYTHVDSGIEEWKDHWQALTQRFNVGVDYSGLEHFDRHSWHRKLHFFEVPFYYVEYGIAQLGALQVWLNSKKDYEQAVNMYRAGLSLGGARPLPELFETTGCKFDFSEQTVRPLIEAAMEEIESL